MKRKLSLVIVFLFLIAFFVPFVAFSHSSECTHSHSTINGPDVVKVAYTSTCPSCGNIGRAIGKDKYSGRIMFECKYGHRWTD